MPKGIDLLLFFYATKAQNQEKNKHRITNQNAKNTKNI